MDRDFIEEILRDHAALGRGGADPELEAVRAAILIEDIFDITLSDSDIDAVLLADASAVTAMISRLRGAV
jgi:hypothetical protein